MRNNRSIIENRRKRILMELKKDGNVSVQMIASELNASPLTIRRDLAYLEEQGLLKRRYGGASLCGGVLPQDSQIDILLSCRKGIAKRAAEFITDGDTIFINSSSSALLLLQYVTAKGITVITNNGKALEMNLPVDITMILTGGELRKPKASMTGDFAVSNLGRVSATKAFLGCSGLTAEEGFTTASIQEVAVNQAMLERATGKRFILADHTKVGKRNSFISGTPEQIDVVITDTYTDRNVLEALEMKDVCTIQAEPLV